MLLALLVVWREVTSHCWWRPRRWGLVVSPSSTEVRDLDPWSRLVFKSSIWCRSISRCISRGCLRTISRRLGSRRMWILVEIMRVRLIISIMSLVPGVKVSVTLTEASTHSSVVVSPISTSVSGGSMCIVRVSLVIQWLRAWVWTWICTRYLIISAARQTPRQTSGYRGWRDSIVI